MTLEEIRTLYSFNRWANARVLDAAGRLGPEEFARDLGSSYGSVRSTLVHVAWAEWVWLRRWLGESPRTRWDEAEFPTLEALRARWSEVEREQWAFVAGLGADALDEVIAYVNARGEEWRYPLWQMLLHVVNHGTYHRGQTVTLLRQLGAQPPLTDFLYYIDDLPPAPHG
jgi:uncharacterized damage-inducible protein DinB